MPIDTKNREGKSTIHCVDEISEGATSSSYTFYPTFEEIENFTTLIKRIEEETSVGHMCGVIKIVPPEGWKPRKAGYTNKLIGDTKITRPVTETFSTAHRHRCYTKDVSVYRAQVTWNELQNYARKKKLSVAKGNLENRVEIDKMLWDSMQMENMADPVYGADTEGTLYDEDVKTLNISHLGTILDDLKHMRMPGVTTTYLYFGMWRTMFPWHAEDVDLYSINYLHHGSPKHWWSIPPEAADLFERMMSQLFPDDANKCPAFLRHKNFIVHPEVLREHGIPFSVTIQRKNEFIVTLPRGYHMGYNTGLNVAESTNFASDRWIDFGMNCVLCRCKKDAVTIDIDAFVVKYRPSEHRKWSTYWLGENVDENRLKAIEDGKRYKLDFRETMLSKNECNLYDEKQYNTMRSKHFPHCSVCEAFLPEECCEYKGEIPKRSRRFVTSRMFEKKDAESVFDKEDKIKERAMKKEEEEIDAGGRLTPDDALYDPKEDNVLVCENCKVSVHEECYVRLGIPDEDAPWKCVRCRENDKKIRYATCCLCELRGGALVKAKLGSTPTFVHVVCALAHRRAFFLDPAEHRNEVHIHPPSKYKNDDAPLRSLCDAAYLDVSCSWNSATNRYKCQVCDMPGEGLMVCEVCVLEEEEDVDIVHATCARSVKMRLERRTFPINVALICHKHEPMKSRIKMGSNVQRTSDGRCGIVAGYEEKEDGRGEGGEIKPILCTIFFDSNEVSVIDESNILECWCYDCDGKIHTINTPIVVRWDDDKHYPAYYRGHHPPAAYKVQFEGDENGEMENVSIDDLVEYSKYFCPPSKKPKKARQSTRY